MTSIKSRVEHFTWANFAFTIAGGGVSSMLKNVPYRFRGLTVLGDIVFLFNFTVFWIFHACMITRFIVKPGSFKRSLTHRVEGQFFPTYLLTWATILMDTELYARGHTGEWRPKLMRVLFWIYVGVCCFQGICQYAYIYLSHKVTFSEFGPGLLLIIFPAMLSGCIATTLIDSQPSHDALPMLIGGSTLQLMGFNVSMMLYAILICKLMVHGLPHPDVRPALFIMVGPLAFTGLSIMNLGKQAERVFPLSYVTRTSTDGGSVYAVIGLYQALICWATCLWMFFVTLLTVIHGVLVYGMRFRLAWCAMVFPSAGMTILTMKLGETLECPGLKWVGTALAAIVSTAYLLCIMFYITAILKSQIIYPGKDEDAHSDIEGDEKIKNYKSALSSASSTSEIKKA
nr:Mae1 [Starmerella bombicola]